jgi:hypothetical protein
MHTAAYVIFGELLGAADSARQPPVMRAPFHVQVIPVAAVRIYSESLTQSVAPELLCQALWWWRNRPVQAVDSPHVTGMQGECPVTTRARKERPPLRAHDASHLYIIYI